MKLLNAILTESIVEVEELVKENIDLSGGYAEYSGNTPLHLALLSENQEIIKLIIKHSNCVNFVNSLEKTPLHYASSLANLEAVKLLIDKGADCYMQDIFGNTPLFYSVAEDVFGKIAQYNQDRIEILCLLLSKMSNFDLNNSSDDKNLLVFAKNMLDILNGKDCKSELAYNYIFACASAGVLS